MEKERIAFPKGKQADFIKYAKETSGKTWRDLSEYLEIPYNTLRTCYKENMRLSYSCFKNICLRLLLNPKEILEKYSAEKIIWIPQSKSQPFNNVIYIGKSRTFLNKPRITYSNEQNKLNTIKISFSKRDLKKNILLPQKITPALAEEVGMHLGDGFLSSKRYEYRLKGNKKDEIEYYQKAVKPLFKELYNVDLQLREYKSVFGFELYSKAIWNLKQIF